MNELCKVGNCPGYKKCNGFEWYDYGDFRWCPFQIYWAILNAESLRVGNWPSPPEHLETDDTRKHLATEAYFVKACSVVAEVDARLTRTGKDGIWLVSLIERECPIDELPYDPLMAFHYITGWHRYGKNHAKWQNYSGWKKHRKYRAKLATKSRIEKSK